jgi:hypothetical protein
MRILKRILLLLLLVFIVIQFIRPEKNIHEGSQPNNIAKLYPVPQNVETILAKACNDCHSNNTRYPWYAEIQPTAWWLADHIKDGKKELNFDEFTTYRLSKQYKRLEQSKDLVEKGAMPLSSYTWIHKDAILSKEEKQSFYNWIDSARAKMEAAYPMDSLIRKNGQSSAPK